MYNDKKNYYKKFNDFKKNDNYVKPVKISVHVEATGTTAKGEYDKISLFELLARLQNNKTFDMLTVSVNCARSDIESNPDARGTKTVGKILSYDDGYMNILLYGNFVHIADRQNLTIVPKVRTQKNSTEVSSIDSFTLHIE